MKDRPLLTIDDIIAAYAEKRRKQQQQKNGPGAKSGGASGGQRQDENAQSRDHYIVYRTGEPRPILANVLTALRQCPEWVGVFAQNLLTERIVLLKPLPSHSGQKPNNFEARDWTDADTTATLEWLQRFNMPGLALSNVHIAIEKVAIERAFDPLKDYFESLTWDGQPRIEDWLVRYCGAVITDQLNEDYLSAVGPAWLIAAVARGLQPGCQADNTLILVGRQGVGKSSAFRALGGDWFSDCLPHDLGQKDAAAHIIGKWIIEMGELATLTKSEAEDVKSYVSRRVEQYRPVYLRVERTYPNSPLVAATTTARLPSNFANAKLKKEPETMTHDSKALEGYPGLRTLVAWAIDDAEGKGQDTVAAVHALMRILLLYVFFRIEPRQLLHTLNQWAAEVEEKAIEGEMSAKRTGALQ